MTGRNPVDESTTLDACIPTVQNQCYRLAELLFQMHAFILVEIVDSKAFSCKECEACVKCDTLTDFLNDIL